MIDSLRQRLHDLIAVPGLAGHEDPIIRRMATTLAATARDVEIDRLGNVIARYGAGSPRIAVLAHLDTVGLLVQRVHRDGSLGVVPVGGINLKALPGSAVRLHTASGERPGLIGVRSQHLARPGDLNSTADDIYIDAGAAPVEIATPVTYAPQALDLGECFSAPYLDNRAGCAVLLELAERLLDVPGEVILIGTVQEETTCAGAHLALAAAQPDAALFVDGTVSYDTPDTAGRGTVTLGGGPVLTAFLYVSGLNGWHAHPALRDHLKDSARAAGLAFQQDAVHGLMSDARAAVWSGIPSAVIGLPLRGKHGPLETVDLRDAAAAVTLLLTALKRPLPDLARG
jgi:putative aminopeptidase FrvX